MKTPEPISVADTLARLTYLPKRTPAMAFDGGADGAFAELARYRDGALYVGHYSGDSEWERHAAGDEIVMALAGRTTLVLWLDGRERRVALVAQQLLVVPRDTWHRFEDSRELQVLTVTPQPTEHRLEAPDG